MSAIVAAVSQPKSPVRDRSFNPWRCPVSEAARGIISEAIGMLQAYEGYYDLRQRQRRPADQAVFEATVSAVLCDLMYHHVSGRDGGIAVTRSHRVLGRRSRYRPSNLGKTLPHVIDMMASREMDFVVQELGHQGYFGDGKQTVVRPGWRTLQRISQHDLTVDDFGVSALQEVIILRRKGEGYWDRTEDVEYEDTPITNLFRSQMQQINSWLAGTDIAFDEGVLTDPDRVIDANDRGLRRIFTQGRFDRGGRLYGGFWQQLGKDTRRRGLEIDGEPVVELDYGQMSPRILYGLCGAVPEHHDLYILPGFGGYRKAIKKLMNAMLFSDRPLSRMPRGVRCEFGEHYCGEPITYGHMAGIIQAAHTPIAHRFFTGVGHELQYHESQILVDVLERLREGGIVALPIHDAVLVPRSAATAATDVMHSVFREHTGIEGVVRAER